jgi:hypothetical protein
VRRESDSSCEECGEPAPFRGEIYGHCESKDCRGGRADEGVKKIPDGVEVRDFVGKEFEDVKADGETENYGMRKDVEFFREMDDVEALEKTERGDGGVEVEAGREAGAEGQGDGLERVHLVSGFSLTVAAVAHKGFADVQRKSRFRTHRKALGSE